MRSFTLLPLLVSVLAFGCKPDEEDPLTLDLAPEADAGTDLAQPADRIVSLDGRGSFDPEGAPLYYIWAFDSVPAGSAVTAESFSANRDASGETTFRPDKVGTYIIKLTVNDGGKTSPADYAIVNATEPTLLPVANAGVDQTVDLGGIVSVDGSASYDPLGGALTYAWSLVDVPLNSGLTGSDLGGATAVAATFEPDVSGDYTVTLLVDNGMATSKADSVNIRVAGDDAPPVADAGDDYTGEDCTLIELDCSNSADPEGLPLKYFWEIQSKPSASAVTNARSFADRNDSTTTFWPDVAGTYTMSCSVFDGTTWSSPDVITLTLAERAANTPPIANAGADRIESAGEATCVVDGYRYDCEECQSFRAGLGTDGEASDPDGDPIVIGWEVVDSSAPKIIDADSGETEVVLPSTEPEAPGACVQESWQFKLTVQDCPGTISNDTVVLAAECCGI